MLEKVEKNKISNDFIKEGFLVRPVIDKKPLIWIKDEYIKIIKKEIKKSKKKISKNFDYLNNIHKLIRLADLNNFRLKTIQEINKKPQFAENYYKLAKPFLDCLIGDELAMQQKINLSIQFPKDASSLLEVHADTWSGNSPFELVVWIPLVNCYKTKSMYILPRYENPSFEKKYKKNKDKQFHIFKKIKKKVKWININFGEVLIFNLGLPHGNVVNKEKETRWSMNCRFKNLFSPYVDKKLGEYFKPLNLKPMTKIGLNYKFPDEN